MNPDLSPRQVEIVELIKSGVSTKVMSEKLFVTDKAIKSQLTEIYKKKGVTTRYELMALFLKEALQANEAGRTQQGS